MSGIRTSRTRLLGAASAVALGTLALTACNGTTSAGARDASPGASASVSAATSPSAGSATTAPSAMGASVTAGSAGAAPSHSATRAASGTRPTAHTGAGKGPVPSGKPVTCEGSNTRTVAAPLNRPVNHMLLTVTNTGSRPCYLYGYPAVRFGEAQSVPPVIQDSHPQAVVTLQPAQSGYASVSLAATDGSGTNGHTVTSLSVYFQGPSGTGSVGAAAHPPLPARGVYVDDSLKATYWQQSMDDAVMW